MRPLRMTFKEFQINIVADPSHMDADKEFDIGFVVASSVDYHKTVRENFFLGGFRWPQTVPASAKLVYEWGTEVGAWEAPPVKLPESQVMRGLAV